ncbi:MAG: ABC transporter substrate-binding protein [Alphaproteobacteria bacterium]
MTDLTLSVATCPYDRVASLRDGEVTPKGITLDYSTHIPAHDIFLAMVERGAYDVSEMSLALYTISRARGDFPFVALPIFPSRVFRHGNLFVNRKTGIETPKGLEGRRVGIQEYRQTAGIWMRGMLRDEYGVDTGSINWVEGGVDIPRGPKDSDVRPDAELSIERLPEGGTLSEALANGDIDVILSARQPASARTCEDVIRLIPDFRAVEQAYVKKTGIFPIMHTVVMKERLYRENPWIAASLYRAFEESKALAMQRLRYSGAMMSMLPWQYDDIDEMDRVFGGDPWAYGVDANRAQLDTFYRYLVEERFLPEAPSADDLFAPVAG